MYFRISWFHSTRITAWNGSNLLRPGTIPDTPLFFGDHQREIGHLGPAVDHSHGHCRRQTDAPFLRLKYQGDSFRTEFLDPILLRQIFQAVCRDFSDRIPKQEIGRPRPTVGFRAIIPEREWNRRRYLPENKRLLASVPQNISPDQLYPACRWQAGVFLYCQKSFHCLVKQEQRTLHFLKNSLNLSVSRLIIYLESRRSINSSPE